MLEFLSAELIVCVIVGCKPNLLLYVSRGYLKAELDTRFRLFVSILLHVSGKRTAVNDL